LKINRGLIIAKKKIKVGLNEEVDAELAVPQVPVGKQVSEFEHPVIGRFVFVQSISHPPQLQSHAVLFPKYLTGHIQDEGIFGLAQTPLKQV